MKLPKFVGLYLLLWGKGKDEQLSIELMIPQFDKAGKRLNHTYTCPKNRSFCPDLSSSSSSIHKKW